MTTGSGMPARTISIRRRVSIGESTRSRTKPTARRAAAAPAPDAAAQKSRSASRRTSLRRTIQSPTATRSTKVSCSPSSTKTWAGADERTPSTRTTRADFAPTWHRTPTRRSRSPASSTHACSPGSAGIGSPSRRAAVAWLTQAVGGSRHRTAAACRAGVTGTVASTYTPRRRRRNLPDWRSFRVSPAANASPEVNGLRGSNDAAGARHTSPAGTGWALSHRASVRDISIGRRASSTGPRRVDAIADSHVRIHARIRVRTARNDFARAKPQPSRASVRRRGRSSRAR